jgi:hypothetical protein
VWRSATSCLAAARYGGDAAPPTTPSSAVQTVTVTPPTATLIVGDVLRLTATPKTTSGGVIAKTAEWSVNPAGIVTVATDGAVTAVAAGSASVTATVEGKSGSSRIDVSAARTVRTIALDYAIATLARGQSLTLTPTMRDSAGEVVPRASLTWVASDPAVVQVDPNGTLTAVAAGTTRITASVASVSAMSTVTVVSFVSIRAGANVTCALASTGTPYCAGATFGSQARPIPGALRFSSIDADGEPPGGRWQVCGLALDKTAHCWGANFAGHLGVGDRTDRSAPTRVVGSLGFEQMSVGRYHACGLTSAGAAFCWGSNSVDIATGFNSRGALGVGDTLDRVVPTAVAGELRFAQIEAGWGTTCALTLAGEA